MEDEQTQKRVTCSIAEKIMDDQNELTLKEIAHAMGVKAQNIAHMAWRHGIRPARVRNGMGLYDRERVRRIVETFDTYCTSEHAEDRAALAAWLGSPPRRAGGTR
jgi:hypothetical protein